jgi:CubicO group peptidase (beta-lactamase class C family)
MHIAARKFLVTILSLLILIIFSSLTSVATAVDTSQSPAYQDELHTYINNQMETYDIPGLAIAIVRNGEVEYLGGFGAANANGDPVTPDTPFLLASVSKSITAVGVMQLVEAGKIKLEDPVQLYLPWFEAPGDLGGEVTVADLLYQTSGYSEVGGLQANLYPDSPDALEAMVRDLAAEKLRINPGEGWEYSNLNYAVLGLLIQSVSGQPYEAYIEAEIFAPLEMRNSYTSLSTARSAGAASGYYPFFGTPVVFDNYMPYTRATLPAAGLWSSASDMSHYLIAHLDDGQYNGTSILSAASTQALHTPGHMFNDEQGYAMGWTNNHGFMSRALLETTGSDLLDEGTLTVLFHEGDWVNYKSMAFLIPEVEYGMVLLMNSNDPAILSVFRFFAWDVALIATGGEAQYFPPAENFITRNSRWITGLIVLLFGGGLVWMLRTLKKIRPGDAATKTQVRKILLRTALPLTMVVALVGTIFLKFLPDQHASLPVLIRFMPDVGILLVLLLLLAVGLGIAGAALIGATWRFLNQPDS